MTEKRILAVGIAVLIAIGTICPVFAGAPGTNTGGGTASTVGYIGQGNRDESSLIEKSVKVTKEEAKKTAVEALEKYFGLELDEKRYQMTIQLQPQMELEEKYVWSLNWNSSNIDSSVFIYVEIDAMSGKLLSFRKSEGYRNQEQLAIAAVTKEQAQKTAEEYAAKINPEEFKQTKLPDYQNDGYYGMSRPQYRFSFIREINGIKYGRNFIVVSINGVTGTVMSYELRWDYDDVFPKPAKLISREAAVEKYRSGWQMELSYIPYRNRYLQYKDMGIVKLAYVPKGNSGGLVDASTGEFVNYNGQAVKQLFSRDITKEQKDKYLQNAAVVRASDKEIESSRAAEVIGSFIEELFGAGYKIENLSYLENDNNWTSAGRKTWTANISKQDPGGSVMVSGSIVIDACTEELVSIAKYDQEDWYGKPFEPKITWEQAYDKAIELIGKYYPHRLGEINTKLSYTEQSYNVNGIIVPERKPMLQFQRLVNGIPYSNNYISVVIDLKTGETEQLMCNWDEKSVFPAAKGVINADKAGELHYQGLDVSLSYVRYLKKTEDNKYTPDIRIVYTLEPKTAGAYAGAVDAFSGKLLSSTGEEIIIGENSFEERIKGHPSEKELLILAFQGVIDKASFVSDRDITYIELLRMLVNAKGYRPGISRNEEDLLFKNVNKDDRDYPYLREAVRYGLLDNKEIELNLNAKVTREQMTELIVKLLKYEKLAKAEGIFVVDFKDADQISSDRIGYVAIAKGLGIAVGVDGKFRPKDNASMLDAALAIYKALDGIK
ncbi:MAG: YcdB/YcdC domain-containing protein [Caulobacteraceae bacterium]